MLYVKDATPGGSYTTLKGQPVTLEAQVEGGKYRLRSATGVHLDVAGDYPLELAPTATATASKTRVEALAELTPVELAAKLPEVSDEDLAELAAENPRMFVLAEVDRRAKVAKTTVEGLALEEVGSLTETPASATETPSTPAETPAPHDPDPMGTRLIPSDEIVGAWSKATTDQRVELVKHVGSLELLAQLEGTPDGLDLAHTKDLPARVLREVERHRTALGKVVGIGGEVNAITKLLVHRLGVRVQERPGVVAAIDALVARLKSTETVATEPTTEAVAKALPRAKCPACGRDVAVRKGGELREHLTPDGVGTCGASGTTLEELAKRAARSDEQVIRLEAQVGGLVEAVWISNEKAAAIELWPIPILAWREESDDATYRKAGAYTSEPPLRWAGSAWVFAGKPTPLQNGYELGVLVEIVQAWLGDTVSHTWGGDLPVGLLVADGPSAWVVTGRRAHVAIGSAPAGRRLSSWEDELVARLGMTVLEAPPTGDALLAARAAATVAPEPEAVLPPPPPIEIKGWAQVVTSVSLARALEHVDDCDRSDMDLEEVEEAIGLETQGQNRPALLQKLQLLVVELATLDDTPVPPVPPVPVDHDLVQVVDDLGHVAEELDALEDQVIGDLEAGDGEAPLFDVDACSRCGCTDDLACKGGCFWVQADPHVCSKCATPEELAAYRAAAAIVAADDAPRLPSSVVVGALYRKRTPVQVGRVQVTETCRVYAAGDAAQYASTVVGAINTRSQAFIEAPTDQFQEVWQIDMTDPVTRAFVAQGAPDDSLRLLAIDALGPEDACIVRDELGTPHVFQWTGDRPTWLGRGDETPELAKLTARIIADTSEEPRAREELEHELDETEPRSIHLTPSKNRTTNTREIERIAAAVQTVARAIPSAMRMGVSIELTVKTGGGVS